MKKLITIALFVAGSLALMAPALTVPASASPTVTKAHLLRTTITVDQDIYLIVIESDGGATLSSTKLDADATAWGTAVRNYGSSKLFAETMVIAHLLTSVNTSNEATTLATVEADLNTMINQELGLAPAGLAQD